MKLNQCPWCRAQPIFVTYERTQHVVEVRCENQHCNVQPWSKKHSTHKEAADAWNARENRLKDILEEHFIDDGTIQSIFRELMNDHWMEDK